MPNGETIDLIGALGTWVAGIGSLLAVVVALWLARRDSRVRLKCRATQIMFVGGKPPSGWVLEVRVTNAGARRVVIDRIEWRSGHGRKAKRSFQLFSHSSSDRFPKALEHGETAIFRDSTEGGRLFDRLARALVDPGKGRPAKSVRVVIGTSVGHVETVRPEQVLLNSLEQAAANPSG